MSIWAFVWGCPVGCLGLDPSPGQREFCSRTLPACFLNSFLNHDTGRGGEVSEKSKALPETLHRFLTH